MKRSKESTVNWKIDTNKLTVVAELLSKQPNHPNRLSVVVKFEHYVERFMVMACARCIT